ncbi:hypothetical protein HPULCUR_003738 [Helicostylum pulchrum]|uniref:sn-1-specific diacylglycerol lipase n=1 Tax=Helicostylum pulchrum TaxID=562976 RepID=A0ABP9XU77_9FUNG
MSENVSHNNVDLNAPLKRGKIRIQILNCFLNVKVQRPYVILTLGEQHYQTSVSESREGCWNETFELDVTFHAQLFGTIQLDLYENFTIYPDKHIGRTEIRLKTLELMPETFDNYYEIWDKKLSTGASSSIGRERAAVNNMGALLVKICYKYWKSGLDEENLGQIKEVRTAPPGSTDLMTEEQLAAEFKRHLVFQRQRKKANKSSSIRFKKYDESTQASDGGLEYDTGQSDGSSSEEENLTGSLMQPLKVSRKRADSTFAESDDEEFGEMVAAPVIKSRDMTNTSMMQPIELPKNDNDTQEDDGKTFLDSVGSWTGATETSQVIRTIAKLLATFNQGFELTNMQVITGFTVLEKFYTDLPRERTWDIVQDLSEIDMAARFWKFSIASYGWKGLNFIGKGNGIISDAMREHSDAKSIIEYLTIPKEDLLAYEFRSAEAFRPSYFIARDRFTNSIVLSIRGTMSVMDTLTDLVCEYEPWKGGFIHSGMKSSAMWFFRHVAPQLIAYSNEHSTTGLVIVGHSLGAATAAILTIILTDYMDEFKQDKEEFELKCFGYAPACGLSLDLAEKYSDVIQSFIFADDVVSKLSYGSMMDLKELIIASSEAARNMGVSEILWSGDPEGEKWQTAFKQIAEVRKRCLKAIENPRLYVAGKIFQFWLDPTPSNETRIVIEKSTATKVCHELVVKKSIIMDHLPTNFDVAFRRARETIMLEGSLLIPERKDGVLDPMPSEEKEGGGDHKNEPVRESLTELGLKGTTDRTGGEGKVLGGEASRLSDSNKSIILYVGRVSYEKNIKLAIKAYRAMDHMHCHLVIVGHGLAFDEIQSLCSNIFAFPSTTETFGQVVLDAMASGLPVRAAGYVEEEEIDAQKVAEDDEDSGVEEDYVPETIYLKG